MSPKNYVTREVLAHANKMQAQEILLLRSQVDEARESYYAQGVMNAEAMAAKRIGELEARLEGVERVAENMRCVCLGKPLATALCAKCGVTRALARLSSARGE